MPQGMFWQFAAGSFGVVAAILLVGGWVLLRYQRDRQQLQLMQAALERGITALPGAIPGWLISLRQGVLSLVLGVGVIGAGWALHATAGSIEAVPAEAATSEPTRPADLQDRRPPPPPVAPDQMAPGRRDQGPRDQGPREGPPPRFNPAMERWHQVQTQRLAGLVAICAGSILALLGIVRIAFSRLERKYAGETAAGMNPTAGR